jgi:hypothetical protein
MIALLPSNFESSFLLSPEPPARHLTAQKLEVRLFTQALKGANKAASQAAKILQRLSKKGAGAASGDLALGALLDGLGVLLGHH